MSTISPALESYERAIQDAREDRASRTSKALSCALCGGWYALFSLDAMLDNPGELTPYECQHLTAIAIRLRSKLQKAERLEKMT